LNILLYTAYFPPETGSGPNLFFQMGRELARRGHRVGVVTGMPEYHVTGDASMYRGNSKMLEQVDGAEVLRLRVPQPRRDSNLGRGLWHLSAAFTSARGRSFAQQFDVAAVFSPPVFLALAPWWNGIPFLLSVQDLFPQGAADLGALGRGLLYKTLNSAAHWIYKRSSLITVHAPSQAAQIGHATKVTHFPNWVDTEELAPRPRNEGLRKEWGCSPNDFVVTFAGIIGRAQGLDVVLHAAPRLRDDAFRFVLVGDGVEQPSLKAQAEQLQLSNVHFLPMQPQSRYADLLAASDVCLVTLDARLRSPVIPSKIGSIMAAGRPIIAALPDGDAAQLIRDSDSGVVVPPGDAEELARAIRGLRDDAPLRERLAANGRRYAVENHSLDVLVPRFESLLQQISPK
jgi:colanic acid biosynthesis glycosyl transferase WcaI